MNHNDIIKSIRRNANIGLYGSIAVVLVAIIFHFSPFHVSYQSPEVARWMLISGSILAVLAVAMELMMIRRTAPRLRQLDDFDAQLQGYRSYIANLYPSVLSIVIIECVLMVLMSDTALLMVTILLVLMLFLAYPNMYKMKNDLGLSNEQMTSIFGDQYIADPIEAEPAVADDSEPEIEDAHEE